MLAFLRNREVTGKGQIDKRFCTVSISANLWLAYYDGEKDVSCTDSVSNIFDERLDNSISSIEVFLKKVPKVNKRDVYSGQVTINFNFKGELIESERRNINSKTELEILLYELKALQLSCRSEPAVINRFNRLRLETT